MSYSCSNAVYSISVTIPGETSCDGRAEFTHNTGMISCRNGVTASGTFKPLGEGQGSVGDWEDKNGNGITFRVWPAGA